MNNPNAESRLAPQEKLVLHSQFAAYMRGESVYPVGIEISPSGLCNASCDFCWYAQGAAGSHRNVFLDAKRLFSVLDECKELGLKSVTWTGGGEPTLHPKFDEIISVAHGNRLNQGVFTNALAKPKYNPFLMRWIRVTMTDKPFKVDCIKPLRAARTLGFAFNYSGPEDIPYLEDTLALAEVVRADYVQVRPALKFHGETVDIVPPDIQHPLLHVTAYKFEEAKKTHGYTTCEGYHFVPFLWEDGNLDVCAYMRKHAGYTLGNVYQNSLKEILDRAPPSVPVHKNCQVCCKEHEINQLIHKSRALEDVNFP